MFHFINESNKVNKVINKISTTVFFIGMMSIIFQSRKINNTIDGLKFFWIFSLFGLILFISLIIYLKLWHSPVFADRNRRFSVIFGFLFGLFTLIPAIAIFINDKFSNSAIVRKELIINRKSFGGAKAVEYYIYCDYNGDNNRFVIKKTLWDLLKENQIVDVNIKRGYLGYDFVSEFYLKTDTSVHVN